jgi:MATE family multidrug resistance protein
MYHAKTWKQKITLYLSVLWPIMVTQMSLVAMNFIDTIMSGRVGTDDLAGVAIGASLWMPVFTLIIGILLSIIPIVAQLSGSGQEEKIAPSVTQALYLAVILGLLVIIIGGLFLEPILVFMDLEPAVQHIAFHYLVGLSIGIIPLFVSNALRNFFDGHGFTRITMLITVLAVPFNVLFNYALIFGHFGMPALGGIGAGYATGITYWIILGFSVLLTINLPKVRHYHIFSHLPKPSWKSWKEQLSIGLPIGLSIFFEATIFSVVTILVGIMYTTTTIGANQITLSFISLLFTIPLSISMALTIVVGYSIGGKQFKNAKQYSLIGFLGAFFFAGFNAILLITFKEQIASLYTDDPEVIMLASQLFLVAVLFQFSDSAQASLQGVLRGYKDVTIPFYIAFVSYWIIGIPTGYLLAAYSTLGPFGLWIGISIGLSCAAIGFLVRLRITQSRIEQTLQSL